METHPTKRLLLIGFGNMGKALISPLIPQPNQHEGPRFELTIVSPNTKPDFKCEYFNSVSALEGHSPFDIILLCCKPFHVREVMKQIPVCVTSEETLLVSILGGIEMPTLNECGSHLKGTITRMMPNLGVQVRKGIMVVLDATVTGSSTLTTKLAFLEHLGTLLYARDQREFDALSIVSGCGTGYVSGLISSFAKAWQKLDGRS